MNRFTFSDNTIYCTCRSRGPENTTCCIIKEEFDNNTIYSIMSSFSKTIKTSRHGRLDEKASDSSDLKTRQHHQLLRKISTKKQLANSDKHGYKKKRSTIEVRRQDAAIIKKN